MSESENTAREIGSACLSTGESDTKDLTLVPLSGDSSLELKAEGLTTLQQLKKSSDLLLQSMEKSLEVEDTADGFNPMPLVEAAKALATTAQAQVSVGRFIKDMLKK